MKQKPVQLEPDVFAPHTGKSIHRGKSNLLIVQTIFFLVLLLCSNAFAGVPVTENIFVTDVSTVSFSVIWSTDEACTAGLEVYSDAAGSSLVSGASIIPHPVLSGDSAIKTAAEDSGVMKVMVTGLQPDTTYYFKTISTSKSTSDVTESPDASPYLSVTTQSKIVRTYEDNGDIKPFSNDVIIEPCYLSDGSTAAVGSLLIATIPGVNYPITAFVGDGVDIPYAIIDLNNAFSSETNANVDLQAGEVLTLMNSRGINGASVVSYTIPLDNSVCSIAEGEPNLIAGSNFISFPLEPDNPSTPSVLDSIIDQVESIWTYNAETDEWKFWDKITPSFFLTLLNMHSDNGFWLNTNSEASLLINGNFTTTKTQLYSGQNLVGFKSIVEVEVTEAIASIYEHVVSIWTFNAASGNWEFWDKTTPPFFITLKSLKPGQAYWFNVSENCEW